MKQAKLLLCLLLFVSTFCNATHYDLNAKMSVDRYKNINFFGTFQDSILFKNKVLYNYAALNDVNYFVAHCDSQMNVIWYREILVDRYGGFDTMLYAASLVNDKNGNIILAVAFAGRLKLAPGISVYSPPPISSYGRLPETIVVAKYDTGGNLLWYKSTWGQTYTEALGLGVDSTGSVYLSSAFEGNIGIATDTLHGALSDPATFFAKFDSLGNLVWLNRLTGKKYPVDGVTDPSGNMYISGRCVDTQICGGDVNTYNGYRLVTASFGGLGTPNWQRFIFDDLDNVSSISVGSDGSGVIAATLTDTARFNSLPDLVPYTSTFFDRTFVCKYDSSGTEKWAKKTKGIGVTKTAVDGEKNVYVSGIKYTASALLDTQDISMGKVDYIDLVKLDSNGNFLCQLSMGVGVLSNMVVDADNDVYTFGYVSRFGYHSGIFYAGTDSSFLYHEGVRSTIDYFVVKSDRNCQVKWVETVGRSYNAVESVRETAEIQTIKLYPNPVNERMQVELPFSNFSEAKLAVYDANGNTKSTTAFMGSSYVLDTRVLSEGVYFVRVVTSTGTYWGKFVKQ